MQPAVFLDSFPCAWTGVSRLGKSSLSKVPHGWRLVAAGIARILYFDAAQVHREATGTLNIHVLRPDSSHSVLLGKLDQQGKELEVKSWRYKAGGTELEVFDGLLGLSGASLLSSVVRTGNHRTQWANG